MDIGFFTWCQMSLPEISLTGLRTPGPLILDTNGASNWTNWYRGYKIYSNAAGINTKPEDIQCSVLLHVAGQEAQRVHANRNFTEEEEDRIEPLVRAFKEYCAGKENIIIIRHRLNTHVQGTEDIAI